MSGYAWHTPVLQMFDPLPGDLGIGVLDADPNFLDSGKTNSLCAVHFRIATRAGSAGLQGGELGVITGLMRGVPSVCSAA